MADQNENIPATIDRDPELNAIIARIGKKIEAESDARRVAEEIRAEIAPEGEPPAQQGWLPMCPMPTDLCRVSPFFPMARDELANRDFIRNMVITKSSWGEIRYTGPRLSTHEEDALAALLAILDDGEKRECTEVDNKTTYAYQGSFRPILKLMGIQKANQAEYKRVMESFKLLVVAGMELLIQNRTTRGKSKTKRTIFTNMLSFADWIEETNEVRFVVNPYFYECFGKGQYTLLDIEARNRLNSPTAKALYRFTSSHRGDNWDGHYMTLAPSLNLNLQQPPYEIKKRIKGAVAEMIRKGLLLSRSKLDKNMVSLYRPGVAARKKRQLK